MRKLGWKQDLVLDAVRLTSVNLTSELTSKYLTQYGTDKYARERDTHEKKTAALRPTLLYSPRAVRLQGRGSSCRRAYQDKRVELKPGLQEQFP